MVEEEKFKIHEQGGYFLIVCPNCNAFIKGTTEKHVRSNFKIHRENISCEILARSKRIYGGKGGRETPILRGNYEQKLKQLEVYKNDWFYGEMLEDLKADSINKIKENKEKK